MSDCFYVARFYVSFWRIGNSFGVSHGEVPISPATTSPSVRPLEKKKRETGLILIPGVSETWRSARFYSSMWARVIDREKTQVREDASDASDSDRESPARSHVPREECRRNVTRSSKTHPNSSEVSAWRFLSASGLCLENLERDVTRYRDSFLRPYYRCLYTRPRHSIHEIRSLRT